VQAVVSGAVGGENVGETVEGLQRFPINVRYPREWRDSLERLRCSCRSSRRRGQQITLGTWPMYRITDGPPMLQAARTRGWRAGSMSTCADAT
jgi:Cu(I)/Ag(I) efflux system membrane protein CusA/SilA